MKSHFLLIIYFFNFGLQSLDSQSNMDRKALKKYQDRVGIKIEKVEKIDHFDAHGGVFKSNNIWWTVEDEKAVNRGFNTIFFNPEIYPMINGGLSPIANRQHADEAMLRKLYSSIRYPNEAKRNGIEGSVIIGIIIDQNGLLESATLKKGIGGGCDEEALRVINEEFQFWYPGKVDGQHVKVGILLPVNFKLN